MIFKKIEVFAFSQILKSVPESSHLDPVEQLIWYLMLVLYLEIVLFHLKLILAVCKD